MCERESARVVYESVIPISRMVNITKEGGREVKEERKKKQNMAEFLFFFSTHVSPNFVKEFCLF